MPLTYSDMAKFTTDNKDVLSIVLDKIGSNIAPAPYNPAAGVGQYLGASSIMAKERAKDSAQRKADSTDIMKQMGAAYLNKPLMELFNAPNTPKGIPGVTSSSITKMPDGETKINMVLTPEQAKAAGVANAPTQQPQATTQTTPTMERLSKSRYVYLNPANGEVKYWDAAKGEWVD